MLAPLLERGAGHPRQAWDGPGRTRDVDEALAFYGRVFEFTLRGRGRGMAFIDMGDQFIALSAGRTQAPACPPPPRSRRRRQARRALVAAGAEILPSRGLDFRDPWGNHVQVVEYSQIQFAKTGQVLAGMGLEGLEKTPEALEELRAKGLG